MNNKIFKVCPGCFSSWNSMQEFLADSNLELNGYKADFHDLEYGMFFFTHKVNNCYSTMVLMVNDFISLYSGRRHEQNKAWADECPRYCVDEKNLERCESMCECSFAREIVHIIIANQKNG